jgi:hypothetical protein
VLTPELIAEQPDWMGALRVVMTRPPGVPERRAGQDALAAPPTSRPRRISDDLSWLRAAIDEPEVHGLRELDGTAAAAVWEAGEEGSEMSEHLPLDGTPNIRRTVAALVCSHLVALPRGCKASA